MNLLCRANFKRVFYLNNSSSENVSVVNNFLSRYFSRNNLCLSAVSPPAMAVNRLAREKSPYLLQHAHNPVDWHPWGSEAIQLARSQNKLIFLSVGYSTCHWCHVMERESFESQDVAAVMNRHFVCIKVDREERPDVDHLYMTFVQAATGSGGWPMSVWLTPELLPVYGGTYYPPRDMYGRPGFVTVLNTIAERWEKKRESCIQIGEMVVEQMQKLATGTGAVPTLGCVDKCFSQLKDRFEHRYGGFSNAPKFPQPVYLRFLLDLAARSLDSEEGKKSLEMVIVTLDKMAKGGIYDHISQGFARYSTDGKWHVPHFEKMLYDQGQLVSAYTEAYLMTQKPSYAQVIRDVIGYVTRSLSHPSGGFYSAEDADSLPTSDATEKREGAFCVWTYQEVSSLLADTGHLDLFCFHFDVQPQGNVNPSADPHGELKGQNVLIVTGSVEETAEQFDLTVEAVKDRLEECRKILHDTRSTRPRPHLDNKIITSWNGLMISGCARAGTALQEPAYVDRAVAAAQFIRRHLYDEEEKRLLRSCYTSANGDIEQLDSPIYGFQEDYAFVICALLDLYEASYDQTWLEWADGLQETQDRLFWDSGAAGYFSSRSDDPLIYCRLKDDQDGAEPSGNSVAARNLLRLAALLHRPEYRQRAASLLGCYSAILESFPLAVPALASTLAFYHHGPTHVFVTGESTSPDTAALLAALHGRHMPDRVLALVDGQRNYLYKHCDIMDKMRPVNGMAAAYVCRHDGCSLPVTTPQSLLTLLQQNTEN